jgi:hypothetical protein
MNSISYPRACDGTTRRSVPIKLASWTELPGDHHQVSQNASTTAPAKLLAVFVVDTSHREIVIPDK